MTSPWGNLDDATQNDELYLEPDVISDLNKAFEPYRQSLQTLIDDALDDTAGYFGTNELAKILETAFNARGEMLTKYLTEQLSQSKDFVKTAQDAAAAMEALDK
ncbi:hypothetical protein H7J88_26790 [Mycolicibacterium flavescens]|uniref:Uncharacterized protein n=1 Tax=Mycolicibacterium flavescens TaxID=1776 RepID=A0A1E3RPQ6_MYCFV|nr:hypothetical protein [Mycolicibacterium flavescens]MCV7283249.1 hypothetical protein [Mycolicibacterium flavescens]ODQ91831.1 hypothetical protein BHQ18_02935 [Mycolicibacterium flavescens]